MPEELDKKALFRRFLEELDPKELLRLLVKAEEKRARRVLKPSEQVQKLREAFAELHQTHEFAVGQLVTWKPGFKNRKRPGETEPAIIVQILDEPLFDTDVDDSGASTPYFMEPLDLVLGLISDDGTFLIFHFDSRRFAPFSQDDAE